MSRWPWSRRTRRDRPRTRLVTQPVRSAAVGMVGIVVAVTVPVTAIVGVRTIADSRTGEINVTVPGERFTVLPNTPGALVVQRDREGVVVGLTVLALNPGGHGGTVIVVPTSTATTRADGTEMRVGDAINEGGLAAQQQAVEGLLGVSFQTAAELDHTGLATLLTPYAPFTVNFTDPVVDTVDGADETIVDQDSRDLTADDAARVLLARKEGESEIARIDRIAAVWDAALGDAPAAPAAGTQEGASTTAVPPDAAIDAFLAAVAGGPHAVQPLAVTLRPDVDTELFDVDAAYVHLLMAQVLPGAVSTASGPRVRLVQPRPDQHALLTATAELDALGMNLVLATSGGEAATPERTRIEYYRPEDRPAADQLLASGAFGATAEVAAATEPVRGVNITITLGADFAAIVEAEQAAAASTTAAAPVTEDTQDDEEDG